jgi:hypothetical protein
MKVFNFEQWDRMFSNLVAKAHKKVLNGAKSAKGEFKEPMEIVCNPSFLIRELSKETLLQKGAETTVESIEKEAKRCGLSGLGECSEIQILPAHEPRSLRAGWVLFVTYEKK